MEHSPRRIAEPLRRFFDHRFAAVDARLDAVNARLDSLRDEARADRERDEARAADTATWRDESRGFQEDAAEWLRGMTAMLRESLPVAAPEMPDPAADLPVTVLAVVAAGALAGTDAGAAVRVVGPPVAAARVATALGVAGIGATTVDDGPPTALVVVDAAAADVRVLRTLVEDGATLVAMGAPAAGGDADDVLDLGPRWRQTGVRAMCPGGATGWVPAEPDTPEAVAVVTARAS